MFYFTFLKIKCHANLSCCYCLVGNCQCIYAGCPDQLFDCQLFLGNIFPWTNKQRSKINHLLLPDTVVVWSCCVLSVGLCKRYHIADWLESLDKGLYSDPSLLTSSESNNMLCFKVRAIQLHSTNCGIPFKFAKNTIARWIVERTHSAVIQQPTDRDPEGRHYIRTL